MADWTWTTADALTMQTWSKRFWIEAKEESYFYGQGLVGRDENNSVVVEFPDLEQSQGYRHHWGQVRNLSGSGITGDSTMEGNEEVPNVYEESIDLDQKRNAVRTAGKLSEQYPSDKDARKWAKELLKRWMAETIDQDLFDAITSSPTKALYGGDATTTATIESGDYLTLALTSKAKAYSEKASPKIMPVSVKGKKYYVQVNAPDATFDLKERDAAWGQAMREAQKPGWDNPIFSGADGIWNNTVLHTHNKIATATTWGSSTNLNGATCLFLGVGAAGIAYAKRKIWQEKDFDYGNKVGFCIGAIYGVAKTILNSADIAVVALRVFRSNN
jgi:N4-gp56 family major capsid protein